jgi:hypothetical protein
MGPLERTNLKMERLRLRKAIATDEAAILSEDLLPKLFCSGKFVGPTTLMNRRDSLLKRLDTVELRLESER